MTPHGLPFVNGPTRESRLGFGAMRVAGHDGWGLSRSTPVDAGASIELLRRAVSLGATYIDTADCYGPELSELFIASALFPYPDDLTIATKGGVKQVAPRVFIPDGRPSHLRQAVEGSLSRLRIDAIDHYLLHKIDPLVPFEESLGALIELRDEGKLRHIGVCSVTTQQLSRALKMTPISAVQNRYSLLSREHEPVLRMCEAAGIVFIPWEPLDRGEINRAAGVVGSVAAEHGVSASQIALAWMLSRSPVILPIPGTSSIRHLEENMAAASLVLAAEETRMLEELAC